MNRVKESKKSIGDYQKQFLEIPLVAAWQLKIEVSSSDVSELSSARFSSDSARAGGLSARLGSAREIFGSARLEKLS